MSVTDRQPEEILKLRALLEKNKDFLLYLNQSGLLTGESNLKKHLVSLMEETYHEVDGYLKSGTLISPEESKQAALVTNKAINFPPGLSKAEKIVHLLKTYPLNFGHFPEDNEPSFLRDKVDIYISDNYLHAEEDPDVLFVLNVGMRSIDWNGYIEHSFRLQAMNEAVVHKDKITLIDAEGNQVDFRFFKAETILIPHNALEDTQKSRPGP